MSAKPTSSAERRIVDYLSLLKICHTYLLQQACMLYLPDQACFKLASASVYALRRLYIDNSPLWTILVASSLHTMDSTLPQGVSFYGPCYNCTVGKVLVSYWFAFGEDSQ